MNPRGLQVFHDPVTGTMTYLLWDRRTHDAIIIDPVLNFDPVSRQTATTSLDELIYFLRAQNLRLNWILETHVHADHLSAARELRCRFPAARWAMSEKLDEVFSLFKKHFAWPEQLELKSLGVDQWLRDGDEICAGSLRLRTLSTPGHTPACLTYQLEDWLFTGDALMMPDLGVGRCDFPGGSASQLYHSVWSRIYSFPRNSVNFVGHDYPSGRQLRYLTPLSAQMDHNIHLHLGTSLEDFVQFRQARDKTLAAPRFLDPSLDWNLGAHIITPPNHRVS